MNNNTAISVQGVTFGYDKGVVAVDDISVVIKEHSTVMLIGPNGSGKTTLLKLMVGLLEPNEGSVQVLGTDAKQAREFIGYVPQGLDFDRTFPMTVTEFIDFSRDGSGERLSDIFKTLKVDEILQSQIGELSGGQLQRVLIARSLVNKPKILFLDEPASGIDVGGEQSFYELVKQIQQDQGITVVMVSHQIGLVSQFADQVICINKKLLSDSGPDKKLTAKTIENLFGEKVALHDHIH